MRRVAIAGASLAAATASCAAPAAPPGLPAAVHFDVNSWGTRLHGWTFDASGRGRIEDAVPGTLRGQSRTTFRTVNVGMAGYRRLARTLAFADRLAQQPYDCRPMITDQTYGTIVFRRAGREKQLHWNTGCREPRDQQLQATLVTADRLVNSLIGTPPVQRMQTPRPSGLLDHPEHSPQ